MYVSRTRTRLKVCPNKDLNYDVCVADQNKAKGMFKQGLKLQYALMISSIFEIGENYVKTFL